MQHFQRGTLSLLEKNYPVALNLGWTSVEVRQDRRLAISMAIAR